MSGGCTGRPGGERDGARYGDADAADIHDRAAYGSEEALEPERDGFEDRCGPVRHGDRLARLGERRAGQVEHREEGPRGLDVRNEEDARRRIELDRAPGTPAAGRHHVALPDERGIHEHVETLGERRSREPCDLRQLRARRAARRADGHQNRACTGKRHRGWRSGRHGGGGILR